MGFEIDLLQNYPRPKRDVEGRGAQKSDEDRAIARRFDREFFDGDRKHGYGGFHYHPRFWEPVVPDFVRHYQLTSKSSVLDVGCAKGFMLYDFTRLVPGISVTGVDISKYAIENSMPEIRENLKVADARELPFANKSFDLVISITTIHNLNRENCIQSLKEIQRVSRGKSFVTVDAYHNDEEKQRMFAWNLTAQTVLHVDEWRELFLEAGYTGDYYWFIP